MSKSVTFERAQLLLSLCCPRKALPANWSVAKMAIIDECKTRGWKISAKCLHHMETSFRKREAEAIR